MAISKTPGSIELVCGPMFSGKSEELIRRVNRVVISKQPVQVFKPVLDTRSKKEEISTHEGKLFKAIPILNSAQLIEKLNQEITTIAIDEVQFFDEGLVPIVGALADKGHRLILAGLDQDYLGEPFGIMPLLLAKAEFVTKLQAVCMQCGGLGTRTQRLVNFSDKVLVGASDLYEARCRKCHETSETAPIPLNWDLKRSNSSVGEK
ncbi:MAG: thymidine kinase [Acidobacteriota bacterium]|jgi:thymidine kinase